MYKEPLAFPESKRNFKNWGQYFIKGKMNAVLKLSNLALYTVEIILQNTDDTTQTKTRLINKL